MGIPATMSVSLAHSYAPYRFGAYPPACAPQVHHHYAYEMARQAQAIRDAANWWAMPRVMQPPASFPIMSHTVFGAPAYAFPPVQMPYQQYSVQPLGAIHNTRCATMLSPSSSSDMDASPKPSPDPQFVHVVCNAPLIAPKPLPYHSPRFLQFDLPDDDEDLSHPPYVSRPHKRKRVEEDDEDADKDSSEEPATMKRRALAQPSIPHPKRRSSAAPHAASVAVSGRYMR